MQHFFIMLFFLFSILTGTPSSVLERAFYARDMIIITIGLGYLCRLSILLRPFGKNKSREKLNKIYNLKQNVSCFI